jgi:H/ACA ribonucleoprotein complex subunit 4
VSLDGSVKTGSVAAILTLKHEGIALSRATANAEQIIDMKHGVVAKTERVLMPRGTYPKLWKGGKKQHEQEG